MRKRVAVSAITVVIIALTVSAWLVNNQINNLQTQIAELQSKNNALESQINDLQNQISSLENQNSELIKQFGDLTKQLALERHLNVEIVSLWHRDYWSAFGGLLVEYPFNVTIRNNDVMTVSGLNLNVRTFSGLKDESIYPSSIEINMLRSGEERVIQGGVVVSINAPSNLTYVATLKAGEVVLDEFMLP